MTEERGSSRRPARERLLETAGRLFYTEGIHTVGIDRVIEESGVAKGSLYNNFSGKDELVGAYLQQQQAAWVARLDEWTGRTDDPRAKIVAVFDALGTLSDEPGYRGCAFNNAAAEAKPGSAEQLAVGVFRDWMRERFGTLVADVDCRNPSRLVTQLIMLFDGANVAAGADGGSQVNEAAREAAEALLAGATCS